MTRTRVIAQYSDDETLFKPPEHNGREVIDVTHNRVKNGKYSALAGRAKPKIQQTKKRSK